MAKLQTACALAVSSLLLAQQAYAEENDIRWNGFINLVGGILDKEPVSDNTNNEQYPAYLGYENRFTAMQNSSFALQASKPLTDRLTVTGQLIARGSEEEFKTRVSWAYATYVIDDASTFRFGLLGEPNFFYSDFIDVGTAYNWVAPPVEVYDFAVYYQGVNYLRRDTLFGTDLTTELFAGSSDQDLARPDGTVTSAKVRNLWGGSVTDTYDEWLTIRLMATESESSATTGVDLEERLQGYGLPQSLIDAAVADGMSVINSPSQKFRYLNATIRADFSDWYVMTEGMTLDAHDIDNAEIGYARWYVSSGVRFGKAIYHVTFVRAEDELYDISDLFTNPVSQGLVKNIKEAGSRNAKSYIAGVRFDTTRTTALKVEVVRFEEQASSATEKSGIGKNTLLRTAFNASF